MSATQRKTHLTGSNWFWRKHWPLTVTSARPVFNTHFSLCPAFLSRGRNTLRHRLVVNLYSCGFKCQRGDLTNSPHGVWLEIRCKSWTVSRSPLWKRRMCWVIKDGGRTLTNTLLLMLNSRLSSTTQCVGLRHVSGYVILMPNNPWGGDLLFLSAAAPHCVTDCNISSSSQQQVSWLVSLWLLQTFMSPWGWTVTAEIMITLLQPQLYFVLSDNDGESLSDVMLLRGRQ